MFKDGTYQTFQFSEKVFKDLGKALEEDKKVFVGKGFILRLEDVQYILKHVEEFDEESQLTSGLPEGMTIEETQYLNAIAESLINGRSDH